MDKVVLATRNKGKIREIGALLDGFGLTVVGLDQFPEIGEIPETGSTFIENSRIKARAVSRTTGLVALADDSGLEVDALDGRPGVYSARYAGEEATDEDNWRKLLGELDKVPEEKRTARFRCVMVAMAPDGAEINADGSWEGRIAFEPQGENGFGYDPVFFDLEASRTSAQLTPEEKNARSHRGAALRQLKELWPDFWTGLSKQGPSSTR